MRRLSQGFEIARAHRFSYTRLWRSKSHPYFFKAKYGDGTFTLQIMWFEYWYRPYMRRNA